MREYIEIGSTPCDEECLQVGTPEYTSAAALAECRRFITRIREVLGPEPDGAQLAVKAFPHDFGTYHEVVCYYDTDNKEAQAYAFRCESHAPTTWS